MFLRSKAVQQATLQVYSEHVSTRSAAVKERVVLCNLHTNKIFTVIGQEELISLLIEQLLPIVVIVAIVTAQALELIQELELHVLEHS